MNREPSEAVRARWRACTRSIKASSSVTSLLSESVQMPHNPCHEKPF